MREMSTKRKRVLVIVIAVIVGAVLGGCITAILVNSDRSGDSASTDSGQGEVTDENTAGGAKSGSIPETSRFSDYMGKVFEGIRYPDTFVGVNDVQQTYIYDVDDDGTPEVLAYSYVDTDENYTEWVPSAGFCAIDGDKVATKEIEETLGGMSITDNRNLYATPDKTVYLWHSKSSGSTGLCDITIFEYKLDAGKYTEKILFQASATYEECEAHYDNINEYIPEEAEYISSYKGSEHTKAAWCSTMTDAAGFLSMFDICVLPKGNYGRDWKKAYEDYFGTLKASFSDGMTIQIASHDLNSDGVPEVFLITDSHSGTVNSRTAQCCTFAGGRVISFPLRPTDEVELFGGGRDIRIDKKTGQLYYDGLTGSYGNDQLQFIAHVGKNGFVTDEAFRSGWSYTGAMEIQTSHNFVTLDTDETMEYIFTSETFESKDPLEWQTTTGADILGFIQKLK